MKRLLLLFLSAAGGALAQGSPDCVQTYTFTGAGRGPTVNAGIGCVGWRLTWTVKGFTTATIELDGSQDGSAWAAMPNIQEGVNPTPWTPATSSNTIVARAYLPFASVLLSGLTGSGQVVATLYGYKGTSAQLDIGGENNEPVNAGSLTYYFTDTASDVSGDLQSTAGPYTPKTTLSFNALPNGVRNLKDWVTNAGIPNLTFIPAGAYQCHLHALKSPFGAANLQCAIVEVSATGVQIGVIGTTEPTSTVAQIETEYTLSFVDGNVYTLASASSRIVCRVQAVVTSGAPNIQLFAGDEADSHVSLPSNTVDATYFVPYVGATADLIYGQHQMSIGAPAVSYQYNPFALTVGTPTIGAVCSSGCASTWMYGCTANSLAGAGLIGPTAGTVAGAAVLSVTAYNTVQCPIVAESSSCDIWITVAPAGGQIGLVGSAVCGAVFQDTTGIGNLGQASDTDTSKGMYLAGETFNFAAPNVSFVLRNVSDGVGNGEGDGEKVIEVNISPVTVNTNPDAAYAGMEFTSNPENDGATPLLYSVGAEIEGAAAGTGETGTVFGALVTGTNDTQVGGLIDNQYGLYAGLDNFGSAASTTNGHAIEVVSPVTSDPTSITNNVGINIQDQSQVGSGIHRNLYSEGAASDNLFEGIIQGGIPSGGPGPGIAGCSASLVTGSTNLAGAITSGTAGACTVILTFTASALHGFSCGVSDSTAANLIRQSDSSTNSATFTGTTGLNDIIRYTCIGY